MPADPQSYHDLKVSVTGWLNRDDLDMNVPEFIALAERDLDRVMFVPERHASTTLVASAEMTLPADFWGVRAVWLDTDPKGVLEQMTLPEFQRWHGWASTGRPSNYTIDGNKMLLGPSPDSAYNVKLHYWMGLVPLSDDETDNWLLLAHPDIYLAKSVAYGFRYVMDDARADQWEARANQRIADLINSGRRKQYGAAPFRVRSAVVI